MILALLQPYNRLVDATHMHLLEELGQFARNAYATLAAEHGGNARNALDYAMRSLVEHLKLALRLQRGQHFLAFTFT